MHQHASSPGICFEDPETQEQSPFLYEPADNVPVFMWPINARKLGFRQISHKYADYLSVLWRCTTTGATGNTDEGAGGDGVSIDLTERNGKSRKKILHAFMYT